MKEMEEYPEKAQIHKEVYERQKEEALKEFERQRELVDDWKIAFDRAREKFLDANDSHLEGIPTKYREMVKKFFIRDDATFSCEELEVLRF